MKFYAVLDTNVLVSAMLRWDSVPGNVLQKVFEGQLIPVLNQEIMKEYKEVLLRPKFHFTREIVNDFVTAIEEKGLFVTAASLEVKLIDPKDQIFYEVAMEERKRENTFLVTGNIKHFPSAVYVVTPRKMLDILTGDEIL